MTWSSVSIGRFGPERRTTGEQLVQDRSQAIDVGGRRQILVAGDLFGRHVAGRAHDRPRLRQPAVGLDPLGQAEVGDVRTALAVEQDVRWLQVAVEDPPLMGVVHGAGHGGQQSGRGLGVIPEPGHLAGEAAALDQPHAEIVLLVVPAHLVDRHDARMVEVGHRLSLEIEASDVGFVGELTSQDHLERDGSVEAHLPGLENDAHAAAGNLANDLVIADRADSGGLGQVGGRGRSAQCGSGLIVRRVGLIDRLVG